VSESSWIPDAARYLRQRIEAGERVVIVPPHAGARPAAGSTTAPETAPATPHTEPVRAAAAVAEDSLERIAAEVQACTRCKLHRTRNRAVPGVGPANAGLVVVGEGPGADEDQQGLPFVGRAGQLLTKILAAVQFERAEVFITNIVKCRPPGNRDPEPDEVAACEPYLRRQLEVLQPAVICALGRHAGATLTGRADSMAALRNGTHAYEGIRVFPTYHPAALLRNPQWKRPVWEDIQKVRAAHDAARDSAAARRPPSG
jgi:DNA polymerase